MLLYHFPLNTQESIDNFTNVGLLQDYSIKGKQESPANEGIISQKCLETKINTFCVLMNSPIQFSLAFRFKLKSLTNNAWTTLICFYQNTTNRRSIYWNANTTKLYFGGTPVNPDLNWHNVVVEYQDNTCKIYLDNVLVETVSSQIFTAISLFDRFYDRNYTLQAYIQDIRIYDYALSQAEINEYSRALVVHYPLQGNELNPSVLNDVSGFGNDMQRYGGSSSYDNNSPRADKSLHLVNANQCYYQGNMKWSDFKQFTISAWVYPISNGNYIGAIGLHSTNGGVAFCQFNTAQATFILLNSSGGAATRVADINPSVFDWTHYCMTFDGSVMSVYKNGSLFESKNASGVALVNYINIGRCFSPDRNRYWDGNISDVRIYATALSAEDIKNLYNSPISVSKQHQTMAFEFKENPLYPSKYWRTPTYAEMNYILNTRTNASNLRTLGRVNVNGTYVNGCFLLPDDWVLPAGVTMTIVTNDFTTNTYTLEQFKLIENGGGVFLPSNGNRNGVTYATGSAALWLGSSSYAMNIYASAGVGNWITTYFQSRKWYGFGIRLCFSIQGQHTFSISSASSIRFAPANLQYHCIQHKWRFAEHSYDIIGADNANISDSYNGWIDLFGYGTSGVNYSPTLHTTTNSDYASGDISNTDNDWGINEIQSYDYNVKSFAANKNGIVQHNELRENDSDVNGCYNNKLITNNLIEN